MKYDIIDGQQRITSFTLILLALYSLSLSIGIDETDETLRKIKSALWKYVNREYKKELKAITLNSIEKKCFSDIYDYCFISPKEIIAFCDAYQCSSRFDERVISNFKYIYEKIQNEIFPNEKNEILDFADYILQYIQFIVIEANCNANKVFSMFESINSKGKKLEEIDLIKTYIFSKLDESSYGTYLDRWGQLIIKTEDNLYDYLYNYIKAYLCFYRQNINVGNFKAICQSHLLEFFKESDESVALKKMLDDMYEKVDYYNMLSSTEKAYDLVKNNKFRFFFKVFNEISYKHPKALFLRTLIEYKQNKITKDDVVEIISETISFMMKALSIGNRDSKDVITMFARIMNDIYTTNTVSKDVILNAIAAEYIKQGITYEKLQGDLCSMNAFESNKKLTISILSLFDSTNIDTDGSATISYDQAYTILTSFSSTFSLDHLLVQTPNSDSNEYKYYKDNLSDVLVLKEGHDFPSQIISGMDYNAFIDEILNKIGNLRIYYRDKNSSRQNSAISLPEYKDFYSYADIEKRSKIIVDVIINKCLPTPDIDVYPINSSNIDEVAFPKMDKLIEYGLIHKGDKIYITQNPDESVATLIDGKYVEFNGNKLTLNDWGCLITGWKSIRIYSYVAIVGETETLQTKRIKFINEHNEQAVQ